MTTPAVQLTAATDIETPAAQAVFQQLKEQVAKEGLLTKDAEFVGVDERTGIEDDGALGSVLFQLACPAGRELEANEV